MTRVSFQGERGAYSEAAAVSFFGGGIRTVPCPTFAEALGCVLDKKADCAVLPVENSIEGNVGESSDLLYSTALSVTGETYHRIEHCLIGDGELGEVEVVYSHPQALGQCREFIRSHGMRTVPTYDTAGSVEMVKGLGRRNAACIASRQASEIHRMPVIMKDIADNTDNYTRFFVLAKEGTGGGGGGHDNGGGDSSKTSIIFSVKHERDALYGVMEEFHRSGINLTKIESRPTRAAAWEYNFYVDFEGSAEDPAVARTMERIKGRTLFFKSLGSYRAAKAG